MVDKYVPELLAKANEGADVMAATNVEKVECEYCENRHFAYEECPCMADDWWERELTGDADEGWTQPEATTPPSSPPKKKSKSATSMRQPPESPLSKEVLAAVAPLQVKLMLQSEIEQLEEHYRGQEMPRKLLLAVSIRRQTLADGPGLDDLEVKKRRVGRY